MEKILELKKEIESMSSEKISGWSILNLKQFSDDLYQDYYDLTGARVDKLIVLMRDAKIGVVP